MKTPLAISPHITELANEAFYIDKANSLSLKSWLKDNDQDIALILEQANVILKDRNDELKRIPQAGKQPLTDEEIEYAVGILRDLMTQELAKHHPTQQMLSQSRDEAFANFKVRNKVRLDLNAMSIETLLMHVFKERIDVLGDLLRTQAREKQQRNDQIEAMGELKTLLAGCQPMQGEAGKPIMVAQSHEQVAKLKLSAMQAKFDLAPYLEKDMNNGMLAKSHEIALPYAAYQQLNTALTAHTDKQTNLVTSQQLQIVELNKQITQAWEFLSHLNKRHHDTLQTIIHNMR